MRAIKTVFGPHVSNVRINATKSLIGHALGAAGALEMIAVVKALTTGVVHPTLNFEDPEEEVKDLSIVHGKPETCHPNVAMSNSFGFGGHNSTVVVKRWM